ncbi:hypothetical protein SARC_12588, partial [Sphaeroforma arctica JP610]
MYHIEDDFDGLPTLLHGDSDVQCDDEYSELDLIMAKREREESLTLIPPIPRKRHMEPKKMPSMPSADGMRDGFLSTFYPSMPAPDQSSSVLEHVSEASVPRTAGLAPALEQPITIPPPIAREILSTETYTLYMSISRGTTSSPVSQQSIVDPSVEHTSQDKPAKENPKINSPADSVISADPTATEVLRTEPPSYMSFIKSNMWKEYQRRMMIDKSLVLDTVFDIATG